MASDLIGRSACPECEFPSAHIKIKTDKEGSHPYRHCPDCGAQYFTRNKLQAENLLKKIRPTSPPPAPAPAPAPAPKTEVKKDPAPLPVPEQKFKVVFGVKVPV